MYDFTCSFHEGSVLQKAFTKDELSVNFLLKCLLICFYFFQLVHFVNRDSLGLANDFLSLGFIPEGVDVQSVSDALQASFGDRAQHSRDFQVLTVHFEQCCLPCTGICCSHMIFCVDLLSCFGYRES